MNYEELKNWILTKMDLSNSIIWNMRILLKNTDKVSVNLLIYTFDETEVSVLILFTVAIGILIGYGLTVVTLISAKSELRSLKQKNQSITNELNDLRNVAIDQDIYDTENDE